MTTRERGADVAASLLGGAIRGNEEGWASGGSFLSRDRGPLRQGTVCPVPPASPGRSVFFWERKIQQALELIDVSLGDRLTLGYLSGMLEMSPCHFAHRFKRAVGMAPHRYVIQRRVQRAKALLAFTELPLADVALVVGCANQSHFSALFRRATGVTPHKYRRGRSVNRASFRYTTP